MKQKTYRRLVVALGSGLLFSSCTTGYDANGRPVQSIDAGAAVVGAIAIGAVAYAIGGNNSDDRHNHHNHDRAPHHGHRRHHR